MLEKLSEKLTAAGIENTITRRGFIQQIRLKDGDVVEGLGINKLETAGFGRSITDNLDVDAAFRLITKSKNPQVVEDFEFNMPVGTLVSEKIVDELVDMLPPRTFKAGIVQIGEPYSDEFNKEKGRMEPTYGTFVKMAFDAWQWRGYCFASKTSNAA